MFKFASVSQQRQVDELFSKVIEFIFKDESVCFGNIHSLIKWHLRQEEVHKYCLQQTRRLPNYALAIPNFLLILYTINSFSFIQS